MSNIGSAFEDMEKACGYRGVYPDLKAIRDKGRPKTDCPKWYQEGIEQADYAFRMPSGEWKLTARGWEIIETLEA